MYIHIVAASYGPFIWPLASTLTSADLQADPGLQTPAYPGSSSQMALYLIEYLFVRRDLARREQLCVSLLSASALGLALARLRASMAPSCLDAASRFPRQRPLLDTMYIKSNSNAQRFDFLLTSVTQPLRICTSPHQPPASRWLLHECFDLRGSRIFRHVYILVVLVHTL